MCQATVDRLQQHGGRAFDQGILKGGRITVLLTSCLTGLDQSVLQIKQKFSVVAAYSKPVKQEVNGTVILPPLVFPDLTHKPKDEGSKPAAIDTMAKL